MSQAIDQVKEAIRLNPGGFREDPRPGRRVRAGRHFPHRCPLMAQSGRANRADDCPL
jgi:hypothetical protein